MTQQLMNVHCKYCGAFLALPQMVIRHGLFEELPFCSDDHYNKWLRGVRYDPRAERLQRLLSGGVAQQKQAAA